MLSWFQQELTLTFPAASRLRSRTHSETRADVSDLSNLAGCRVLLNLSTRWLGKRK